MSQSLSSFYTLVLVLILSPALSSYPSLTWSLFNCFTILLLMHTARCHCSTQSISLCTMAFLFAPTNLVGTHTWLGRRQFRSSSINHGLTSLNTRRKAGISMTKQEDNGANGQDTSSRKPQYSFRTRLREETEAPFRKARMFVYGGCAISASVGAFIASLRVIAALSGVSGVQPLNETVCI